MFVRSLTPMAKLSVWPQVQEQLQIRPPKKKQAAATNSKATASAKRHSGDWRSSGRGADIVASWGAALRTGAAGSQDESRCGAIHKQRPYRAATEID